MRIAAGIDCGAGNTKAVIVKDQRVVGKGKVPTGFDLKTAAAASLKFALGEAGLRREEILNIAGTGTGIIPLTRVDLPVEERVAMALGARFFSHQIRTVVDVGAEGGRAVRLDERGDVVDCVIQDRCAAGTGTFVETMARILEIPLEAAGALSLESVKHIPLNAQCVVFTEAEVVGLLRTGALRSDILRAVHEAMAGRVGSLIRRIGVIPEVMLAGGVASNPGFVEALKRELRLEAVLIPDAPEFLAALGAALFAAGDASHSP